MQLLAIDIALLLPEAINKTIIEANRQLRAATGSAEIVLNTTDCLPHVSLAMGGLPEADLAEAAKRLRAIAATHPPVELTIEQATVKAEKPGKSVTSFSLRQTPALQQLHERVMRELTSLFTLMVTADAFYGHADEKSVEYVNQFTSKASFEQYWPHVTAGYGAMPDLPHPNMPFRAAAIALCQLGDHCTCRKILSRIRL